MTVAERRALPLHAPGPRRRHRRRCAHPRPGAASAPRSTSCGSRSATSSTASPGPAGPAPGPMSPLLPHPLTGQPFALAGAAGHGLARRPRRARTPVAHDADDVVGAGRRRRRWARLDARVSVCRACPRLVALARGRRAGQAGVVRRRALLGAADRRAGATTEPRVLVVGLAPAAHGGNRTGRIFTGDRSGDWLFAALHRVGLARTGTSVHAGDGQGLIDTRMVAAVRCAPPDNKPTTVERDTCAPWLHRELQPAASRRCGSWSASARFGWDAALRRPPGRRVRRPAPEAALRPRRRGRPRGRPGRRRRPTGR